MSKYNISFKESGRVPFSVRLDKTKLDEAKKLRINIADLFRDALSQALITTHLINASKKKAPK